MFFSKMNVREIENVSNGPTFGTVSIKTGTGTTEACHNQYKDYR